MWYLSSVREQYRHSPYSGEMEENPYYQERLNKSGKDALQGFDYARACAQALCSNWENYAEELACVGIDWQKLDENYETFIRIVKHWMECDRDIFVSSMIDEQFNEDEKRE